MNKKILKLMVTMMVILLLCGCGKKEEEYSVADFEQDMEVMSDALNTLGYLNEKVEQVEEWVEDTKTERVEETAAEEEIAEAVAEEAMEEAPVEEEPAEGAHVGEAPAEEGPAEEAPVEEVPVEEEPAEEAPAEEEPAEEENGIDPEFKAAMDSYEAFYQDYCDVLKRYNANPTDLTLLTEYMDLMQKSVDMSAKFEAWDESEMNNAELQYYTEVNGRVTQMLLEAGAQ